MPKECTNKFWCKSSLFIAIWVLLLGQYTCVLPRVYVMKCLMSLVHACNDITYLKLWRPWQKKVNIKYTYTLHILLCWLEFFLFNFLKFIKCGNKIKLQQKIPRTINNRRFSKKSICCYRWKKANPNMLTRHTWDFWTHHLMKILMTNLLFCLYIKKRNCIYFRIHVRFPYLTFNENINDKFTLLEKKKFIF